MTVLNANSNTLTQAAYYIERACDYAPGVQYCDNQPKPIAPPAGLRMVTGNPNLRLVLFNSN